MNINAIIHNAYDNFCYPLNDEELEISILTGKDIKKVSIVWGDPFAGEFVNGVFEWSGSEIEITEKKELETHFRWTLTVKPPFKRARYYFKLYDGIESLCYLESGFMTEETRKAKRDVAGYFTFPWMNEGDICRVPEWAENTVWYQIFPARFCRGKTDFVPEKLKEWADLGSKVENGDVFGGNLQGIIDKIEYLADLGIGGIYMTPVNKSPSQHKYDTSDYLEIDPSFGTNEQMRGLVKKAHVHGIKIMLDGVFNHAGWDFFACKDVMKHREKSKYASWFMINDYNFDFSGKFWGQESNSGRGKFYAFAFFDGMPKLNTNNPEVRKYLLDVCERWVKDYDIDGIRLDVANEISHVFCKELRTRMNALKPDFYLMGEIWHNALPWLRGDEFDSVMNYPLLNAIADFCTDENTKSKHFEYAINRCYSMYFKQINRVLFNQMDSHDTVRIVTRCKGNKKRAAAALTLCFAMPGSACIYYGTEVFLEGGGDPDNRRCMPWKEIEQGTFSGDIEFTKKLIQLRKTHSALRSTKMHFVYQDDIKEDGKLLFIEKTSEDEKEKIAIIVNASDKAHKLDVLKDAKILLQSAAMENGVIGADDFAIVQL